MTTPNVSMVWCNHKAKCEYCPGTIETGTPMVKVWFWNRGTEEHKGFNITRYFHPQCWVEQGLDYLKLNPYVPYVRKRAKLEPEQTKQRNILLRRKCSIEQRRRAIKPGDPDRFIKETKLDIQVVELMVEIMELGGMPKSWIKST